MNIDNIFEIIKFVESSNIKEFNLEMDGIKIHIVNDSSLTMKNNSHSKFNINDSNVKDIIKDEDIYNVNSPIIGKVSIINVLNNKSYVNKGSKVKKGDILCTIEAMKLVNEVISDVDGEIVEILVDEGNIVEYGQTMFKIKILNNFIYYN